MKFKKLLTTASVLSVLLSTSFTSAAYHDHSADKHEHGNATLLAALKGAERSEANKMRDVYRHPAETLDFFGFDERMTVVEVSPGSGWYTEILAPALKEHGKFYAAFYPNTGGDDYYSKTRRAFEKKMAESDAYSKVTITDFTPKQANAIAPAGTADLVLTFRNLHNWKDEGVKAVFVDAFNALKAGGVLGVVEHRLPTGAVASDRNAGYYSQDDAIKFAIEAGFTLEATSEVNANPLDKADHEKGVWTLPPVLRLGEQDKEKYLAIGESDRMTLKFRKPHQFKK